MTALSGPILFNNSTGSDSAASGCGPATAISVMLQTSAGSNVANASWSGTISVGDLIYVPANTGRKFNVVAVVGSGSLTFDDNWDDSQMGTAGYVGGKRATLDNADSRQLLSDNCTGFNIELETDQTVNSTLNLAAGLAGTTEDSGPCRIYGSSGGQKTITCTANTATITTTQQYRSAIIENIKFLNTSASKTSSYVISDTLKSTAINFINCTFGESGSSFLKCYYLLSASPYYIFRDCIFDSMTDSGVEVFGGSSKSLRFSRCLFRSCPYGIKNINQQSNSSIDITDCVFDSCSTAGIVNIDLGIYTRVSGSVFYNCGKGVDAYAWNSNGHSLMIVDSIFSNNTVAINYPKAANYYLLLTDRNAFFNNTTDTDFDSGRTFTIMDLGQDRNKITLTADPFVDAANGDFNLNAGAGGGAVLRSTNYTLGG